MAATGAAAASSTQYVYGAHDFAAENEDELSFRMGERIRVIERDDQYQDGWWQGENERGQRGLFPQNYTSSNPPAASLPASPHTPSAGTFAASQQQQPSTSGNSLLQPDLGNVGRKGSEGGQSQMRATLDDIQNHLDELSVSKGGPTVGAAVGSTSSERSPLGAQQQQYLGHDAAHGANGFQQSTQPPMKLERGMSIDETSSLASQSTRDDASLLDQEGDYSPAAGASVTRKQHQQHSRDSTATATGGNYAKDNLARNIQLAQEKEQRRRLAEEQEREQERERMRLSGGPPVEGLVLTDESDIEEGGSDDDDSIFPSRKRGSGIEYGQANGGEDEEEQDRSPSPVQQASVDAVPSRQSQSAATPSALTPAHADDEGDESNYPSPPPETANIVQTAVPPAALASVLASEQTSADRQQDVLSREAQPVQDAHTFDMPGGLHTPSLEPAYQEQQPEAQASAQAEAPIQAPGGLEPSPEIQQGPSKPASKEASASHTPELDERDDFVVPKRDTPVELPSREASPVSASFPSNAQQAGRVRTTSRYSADPANAGQDGLLTIVEQASTGQSPDVLSPTTFSGPPPAGNSLRQSTASSQSGTAGVASSVQSVAGESSRPSSTLGSAFTPATSMPYNPSPRSATFPVKTAGLADPKEWTVDQVVEWGQSKNLDAQVLSKFREHEISGDVLVEMDINTLKEIDILAFGTRARIAKGIKELNAKYYGVPMLSPATSYATDLPTTPEPYSAPQSLQTNFYGTSSAPGQSPVTPAQSYPASPATAQATPVSATSLGTRGLGLAGQSAGGLPEATSRSSKSSMPRSSTGRSRNASGEADDSFGDVNAVQEELDDRALTPKEQAGEGVPPSATSERRRQKSSLGSNVSSVFGRAHGRQKSMTPSIAESNTGSVDTADRAATKTGGKSFFAGTLSRNRKPAPTYQAGEGDSPASQEKTERPAPVLRSPSASAPPGNRLSSRFFAFGGGSSAPTSPEMQNERAKRNISAPLEATSPPAASNATSFESSRSPVASPNANVSRNQEPSSYVAAGQNKPQQQQEEAMPMAPPAKPMTQAERIGSPDHCGWLRKKADRYNAWKDRYLILKDGYLYVLKTPQEEKVKGYINLAGYKFISDGSVGSGLSEKSKYGFKAIHDTLPTHYFSSSDSLTIRNWMKALMKVTIGRDYSAPVTSSSNIKTIPLSVAQAMNPPPRPPSPTSAIRVQKASVKQNPNSLSPQDAAKLMGAQTITPSPSGMVRSGSQNGLSNEKQGSPVSPSKRKVGGILPPLRSSQRKKPISESASMTRSASGTRPGLADDNRRSSFYEKYSDRQQKTAPRDSISSSVMTQQAARDSYRGDITPPAQQPYGGAQHELIDWFNDHLPTSVAPAHSWQDFCSGKLYTRVVENLTGKPSGIDDSQFAKFKPLQPGRTPDMDYLDVLFGCFDYLLDSGVKTEDVSINDLLSGNEPHLIKLAEIIRNKYEP